MFLQCQRVCGCDKEQAEDHAEAEESADAATEEVADFGGAHKSRTALEDAQKSRTASTDASPCIEGTAVRQHSAPSPSPSPRPAEEPAVEAILLVPGQLSEDEDGETRKPFIPLEEDRPIFENDAQRFRAAAEKLDGFRGRVEAELLGEAAKADAADRHFCSDATLLRYLCTCDGSEKKALAMLQESLKWRRKYFASGPIKVCPKCQVDPRSHCFLLLGKDAAGRNVIYSCAGRAANKAVADGMRHMSSELERIFDGSSAPGQVVWIVDFAGFGLADCNPRMGATAVPMFANHYPERFGQIVLFAMPTIFRAIYAATVKILDPVMQRKVLILHSEEARRRYAEHYWSCNPPMAEWLAAVVHCKGAPGCYPDLALGRRLGDAGTRDILERCAAAGTKG